MPKKKRSRSRSVNRTHHKKVLTTGVVIAFILGIIGGFYAYGSLAYVVYGEKIEPEDIGAGIQEKWIPYSEDEFITTIKVPAVDKDEKGVSTDLIVKVSPGTGKTLVDINSLLFWVDTQNSIRMAKLVAADYTGIDTNSYDITYSVDADAALIGGESAGAALAVATIAALQNKEIREDVMVTGTINHDGSIGPVGGIVEKATAAKDIGATTFLVPLLQSGEVIYEESEHCETFGLMEWCTTERIPKKINVESEVGIDVVEVSYIRDIMNYFYS